MFYPKLEDFINQSVVHKDGSTAMTSDFDFGSQKGTNLATPTATTDATNKTYVDSAITTATNALTIESVNNAVLVVERVSTTNFNNTYLSFNSEVEDSEGWSSGTSSTFTNPGASGLFIVGGSVNADTNLADIQVHVNDQRMTDPMVGKFNTGSHIWSFGGVVWIPNGTSVRVYLSTTAASSISSAYLVVTPLWRR